MRNTTSFSVVLLMARPVRLSLASFRASVHSVSFPNRHLSEMPRSWMHGMRPGCDRFGRPRHACMMIGTSSSILPHRHISSSPLRSHSCRRGLLLAGRLERLVAEGGRVTGEVRARGHDEVTQPCRCCHPLVLPPGCCCSVRQLYHRRRGRDRRQRAVRRRAERPFVRI